MSRRVITSVKTRLKNSKAERKLQNWWEIYGFAKRVDDWGRVDAEAQFQFQPINSSLIAPLSLLNGAVKCLFEQQIADWKRIKTAFYYFRIYDVPVGDGMRSTRIRRKDENDLHEILN